MCSRHAERLPGRRILSDDHPSYSKSLIMSKHTRNRRTPARRELTTPDGLMTVPLGRPKILIHTRQGKCVGIYCDQPAKVLMVETQHDLPLAEMQRATSRPSKMAGGRRKSAWALRRGGGMLW